uniref:Putative HNH homing endonuclease n=1 Tax=Hazenia capsulata TaxID=2202518 RepID=A0A1W6EHN9_9CHLO|nr:putative HNH homing endonuclease [Hazenia capsulata]ARK14900.1 putative HNH homing endonuclease [Hazenia capsulata]
MANAYYLILKLFFSKKNDLTNRPQKNLEGFKDYLNFLENNSVQQKVDPKTTKLLKKSNELNINYEVHIHHIIPKYWFNDNPEYKSVFMDCLDNCVLLTRVNHIYAHVILFRLFKDPRDRGAILLLKNQKVEAFLEFRRAGAYAAHLLQKQKCLGFWNSEQQKKNSLKSMAQENAIVSRSLGGKKGGYNKNINKIIRKTDKVLFLFQDQPFLCVLNCQTGGDVLKILYQAKPTSLKRVTPLLKKERKKLNGWSCVWLEKDGQKIEAKKAISS